MSNCKAHHADLFEGELYRSGPVGNFGLGGSVEAAKRMQLGVDDQRSKVLEVVAAAGRPGVTSDEIAEQLGWIVFKVRPRTSDLRRMGKIIDSRERRPGATGIMSIVWKTPEHSQPIACVDREVA